MNILVITAYHPPDHIGGYEIRCKNVLDALSGRGHHITVITSRPIKVNIPTSAGNVQRVLRAVRAESLLKQVVWDVQDLRQIARLINQEKPDVLYLWHTIVLSPIIIPFIAGLDLPLVYDEGGVGLIHAWQRHGDWINYCERKRASMPKELFKRMVCAFARTLSGGILPTKWCWPKNMCAYFNSRSGLEAAQTAGVPLNDIYVVYSGLRLEDFPFKHAAPFSDTRIRLLLPGRVVPIKAINLAIQVVAALKRIAPQRQFALTVAGPLSDRDYFTALKQLIVQLGVQGEVRFIDALPHERISSLYHESDFCFFPSQQKEGLSRVPLEAMACGSLLLSAGNEGSCELIDDGLTGYVLSFERAEDVAKQVLRLAENVGDYREMLARARQTVEARFTLEKAVDQIEQILFRAMPGRA